MARWTENSLCAEVLRRYVPPERWMFLRYEDFAARPQETVAAILSEGPTSPLPGHFEPKVPVPSGPIDKW